MSALRELRVLDGPNRFYTRPAIQVTLDVGDLLAAPEEAVERAAVALRVPGGLRPGTAGSDARRRAVVRLLAHLTRRLAAAAGRRVAVRSRPGPGSGEAVVAYPWRRLEVAESLASELADLVAALANDPDAVRERIGRAGERLREVPEGPAPEVPTPTIPTIAVTGTNGKTTTTRLIAHIATSAGRRVGWTHTEGITIAGEVVERGDWAGFGGAGRVLAEPDLDLAVLEVARGGLLRRGAGVSAVDVAVVTNVAADHLGEFGIDTLDQLAEVKAIIVRIVRQDGWAVLNAEDPRTLAMRRLTRGRPFVFSLDPEAPGVREALNAGGRAITVLDGAATVLDGRDVQPLLGLREAPVTLAALSRHNVANALAAAAATLAIGIPATAVADGLRSFVPDPAHNPGRFNVWRLPGRGGLEAVVILDMAHNEDSLRALLEVGRGLTPPGAALHAIIGTAGDRTDAILRSMGEIAARGADHVAVADKEHYLRDREPGEMAALMRAGAAEVGRTDVAEYPDELAAFDARLAALGPEDVLAMSVHEHRTELVERLDARGGRPASPAQVAARARRAAGG